MSLDWFLKGGWVMIPLIIFSILVEKVGAIFVYMPVHAGGVFVKDLHTVEANIF